MTSASSTRFDDCWTPETISMSIVVNANPEGGGIEHRQEQRIHLAFGRDDEAAIDAVGGDVRLGHIELRIVER